MKQCKTFYKALKDGDSAAAHMLFVRPSETSLHILESRNRMEQLRLQHKAEIERIENMTPEMLKFEIKYLNR